jgi:hypothetical protein
MNINKCAWKSAFGRKVVVVVVVVVMVFRPVVVVCRSIDWLAGWLAGWLPACGETLALNPRTELYTSVRDVCVMVSRLLQTHACKGS